MTIQRLTATITTSEGLEIYDVREDWDLGPDELHQVIRQSDGLVVVSMIPEEDVTQVRFRAQRELGRTESLRRARAAIDVALEALEQ